ncbi:efflux RND transporter periplasmic adaptor subunit [Pseudomonas putida]
MSARAWGWGQPLLRSAATVLVVVLAVALVAVLWQAYVLAPWTRDGRVSAQVVRVAAEVSGPLLEVAVQDNQFVHQGDVLYRIDPQPFAIARQQAQARLLAAAQTLQQRADEAHRRAGLHDLMAQEDIQRAGRTATIAQAQRDQAQAALDLANLDLARTTVRSPVDGYVTHLRLRRGDYAVAGKPLISVLDAGSFWVTGYFEETKLRHLHVGDPARIKLMGFDALLDGHVASLGRGITDSNEVADEQGLPSVQPTFSWIRLAQRIPVRIAIDHVPVDVLLAAGMTCSVEVGRDALAQGRLLSWLHSFM